MPLERQAPCRKASTGIGGANLQIAIIQLAIVIDVEIDPRIPDQPVDNTASD